MTDRFDGQTVEDVRRALTSRLKSGGITSAELDARLLVGDVLGLDLTGMITAASGGSGGSSAWGGTEAGF